MVVVMVFFFFSFLGGFGYNKDRREGERIFSLGMGTFLPVSTLSLFSVYGEKVGVVSTYNWISRPNRSKRME